MNKKKYRITVNGKKRECRTYPMARLLDVLREDMRLTGTKEGCGEGECGACTVLMNGEIVNSCLVPVTQADGARIVTVEGLGKISTLHPLQSCFMEHGGTQCGMCTPGMLMAAYNLLQKTRGKRLSDEEIRKGLSGNLCRCTGYIRIVESVRACARKGM
jgi:carbon-monoxide dehydrogenase small subunit